MKRLFYAVISFVIASHSTLFAGNILNSVRISYTITEDQVRFIDEHFDYVMTPILSHQVRSAIHKPKLILYRSIQGTWTNFNQFDWEHINSCENMFCHSDSADQSPKTRIRTRWDSWLMDGNDLVDSTAADALNHWVNYYAVTASSQVHAYNYDGLFIDSAGHKLSQRAVYGVMPWDYSPETWRDGRYAALNFIKSYLPDKIVIFNGLHSDNGADSSLSFTDGGMWEDFVYDADNGTYKGEQKWWNAIQCMEKNKNRAKLVLVVKKPGLIDDIQARLFSVASYLLVSSPNVVLSLSDYAHNTSLQYYPEYEISLGNALGSFAMNSDSLFVRRFEKGLVAVNPYSSVTRVLTLQKDGYKILPVGGGFVDSTGAWEGLLRYEKISGKVNIPPISALILQDDVATHVGEPDAPVNDFELEQNYPNPFNPSTTIRYKLLKPSRVVLNIYDLRGRKVRTLVEGQQGTGLHAVLWEGRDWQGREVASGIYLYEIQIGQKVKQTRQMLLLR